MSQTVSNGLKIGFRSAVYREVVSWFVILASKSGRSGPVVVGRA